MHDENWLEPKCPSRKEPNKTEAVKVLLFGDSFKDLIQKKNQFILGQGIWATPATAHKGQANAGQAKNKTQRTTQQEARDTVLET